MEKQAGNRNLDIYGYPVLYFDWFLKPELLLQYKAQMDRAEDLAATDSIRLKRVLRQRCSVDFAYLDVALNVNNQDLSFYETINGNRRPRKEMLQLLDRFVENCEKTGIVTLDENGYSPQQYRTQALNIANMATRNNKAAGKTIKSLTEFSPLYNVGGENALTDGLYGGSWIFLPLNVEIEASDNGLEYRSIYSEKIPEPVRNFGQKPVHFRFAFEKTTARFLKLTARSHKTCPDWHRGANQPAWIFIDELVVE
jgi:hypothetical protein